MDDAEKKRAYQRAHYHANKEIWRRKRMHYEAKIWNLILPGKDKPCADCGRRWHPLVMEFDHRPGTEKGSISAIAEPGSADSKQSWKRSPSVTCCARRVTASELCGAWD
jgi:hypothetical protein